MSIKLGNIFEGDILTITQSPHGQYQNYKAIDCRHPVRGNTALIAPTDGTVSKVYGTGQQRYFYFSCMKWRIIFVHCKPIKTGKVKRGQKIGEMVPYSNGYHCHTAIDLNGTWATLLTYMDHSVSLTLSGPFKSQQWKYWKTWGDRRLASCEPIAETKPKPTTPPADLCTQYKDQIVALEKLNREKDTTIKTQGKKIQSLKTEKAILEKQVKDYKGQLETVSSQNFNFYKVIEWLKKLKP